MRHILCTALLAALFALPASAQKLITIAMANTVDKGIDGKGGIAASCLKDFNNFVQESSIVASYLNYEVEPHDFIGEDCTKEKLLDMLAKIKPTEKDIVFFYYSGHGGHAPNHDDPLPQIGFKYSSTAYQEEFMALREVRDKLEAMPSRLNIVMADCCNSILNSLQPRALQKESGPTEIGAEDAANYRKLFLENKGTVVLISSEKGQASWGNGEMGGFFSSAFWDKLAAVGNGQLPPTWEALTQSTKQQTASDTGNEQIPYYDLSRLNPATPVTGTTPVNVVSGQAPALASALKPLIDPTKTTEQRLALVEDVLRNCFTADASVVTVGRNSVNLGYESARSFLRRISLSGRIRELIILGVTTGSDGKASFIKVHEVRQKQ